jgi:hypothetical protein
MRHSRIPVVRMHLVAAAAALFCESQESPTPEVEAVARLVDDALEALDTHGSGARGVTHRNDSATALMTT